MPPLAGLGGEHNLFENVIAHLIRIHLPLGYGSRFWHWSNARLDEQLDFLKSKLRIDNSPSQRRLDRHFVGVHLTETKVAIATTNGTCQGRFMLHLSEFADS